VDRRVIENFVWLDEVDRVAYRPGRTELAWHTEESNRFAIDKFVRYCRMIGADPTQDHLGVRAPRTRSAT
jgi:alpha-L-arabinofuranosidase